MLTIRLMMETPPKKPITLEKKEKIHKIPKLLLAPGAPLCSHIS